MKPKTLTLRATLTLLVLTISFSNPPVAYAEEGGWLKKKLQQGRKLVTEGARVIRQAGGALADGAEQSESGKSGTTLPDRAVVREVQSHLNALGYEVGTPDGIMGPNTRSAIRRYQAASNLTVTGEPDAQVLQSLRQEIAATGNAEGGLATPVEGGSRVGGMLLGETGVDAPPEGDIASALPRKRSATFHDGGAYLKPLTLPTLDGVPLYDQQFSNSRRSAEQAESFGRYFLYLTTADHGYSVPDYWKIELLSEAGLQKFGSCSQANRCSWRGTYSGDHSDALRGKKAANPFEVQRAQDEYAAEVLPVVSTIGPDLPRTIWLAGNMSIGSYSMELSGFPKIFQNELTISVEPDKTSGAEPRQLEVVTPFPDYLPVPEEQAEAAIKRLASRKLSIMDSDHIYWLAKVKFRSNPKRRERESRSYSGVHADYIGETDRIQYYLDREYKQHLIDVFPLKPEAPPAPVVEPKPYFTSRLELTAFLKRDPHFSFGRIENVVSNSNEFERRDQQRALAQELAEVATPENDLIRIPAMVSLGEYDFDRGGFAIDRVRVQIGSTPIKETLPYKAAPGIKLTNLSSLPLVAMGEDQARRIASSPSRNFRASVQARVTGVEVPEGDSSLFRNSQFNAALSAVVVEIVLLTGDLSYKEYKGQSDARAISVVVP